MTKTGSDNDELRSTTIHHDVRRRFCLTVDEYCLADSIYRLSGRENFPWCKTEKKDLGKSLNISERSVYRKLAKLEKKGLIEMGHEGVRSTSLWRNNAEFTAKVAKKPAKVADDFAKVATPSIYNSSTDSSTNKDGGIATIIKAFSVFNPSASGYYGNKTQRKACEVLLGRAKLEQLLNLIGMLPEINKRPYAPVITTPDHLEKKWAQLEAFIARERNNIKGKVAL